MVIVFDNSSFPVRSVIVAVVIIVVQCYVVFWSVVIIAIHLVSLLRKHLKWSFTKTILKFPILDL